MIECIFVEQIQFQPLVCVLFISFLCFYFQFKSFVFFIFVFVCVEMLQCSANYDNRMPLEINTNFKSC